MESALRFLAVFTNRGETRSIESQSIKMHQHFEIPSVYMKIFDLHILQSAFGPMNSKILTVPRSSSAYGPVHENQLFIRKASFLIGQLRFYFGDVLPGDCKGERKIELIIGTSRIGSDQHRTHAKTRVDSPVVQILAQ